jgi:hypothetical protein
MITRKGIYPQRIHHEEIRKGVFCMPVINDFYSTHQWLRELKRFHKGEIAGIYFKIPDDLPVWYGRYNEAPLKGTAVTAVKKFIDCKDRLGYQVIVPEKIDARYIFKIKRLPQMIGWRYYPGAHGKKPCLCPACLARGGIKSDVIKQKKYYDLIKVLKRTKNEEKGNVFYDIDREIISSYCKLTGKHS